MQSASAAKCHECVIGRIDSASNSHRSNCRSHRLVCDGDKRFKHFLDRHLSGGIDCNLSVQRIGLFLCGIERNWNCKLRRIDAAEQYIRIGQCQRSTRAITRRTGRRSCTARTNAHRLAIPPKNRTAARRNAFYCNARRCNRHRSHCGFVAHFWCTVDSCNICARTAHIKRDTAVKTARCGNCSGTCDATCGT